MKGLSLLQYYVKFSSNKLGMHSINKLCEPFFAELFNRIYGYKLKTIEKKNYPAIDLKDKKNRYAVQITSNGSKEKLERTVTAFEDKNMHKDFDTLLHFIIGEKRFNPPAKNPYPFKKGEHDAYVADVVKKNYQIIVQDINDLILVIDALGDEELSTVRNYINENINLYIDAIKKPLYNFVPGAVSPFNANSYLAYYKLDGIDEKENAIKALKKLAKALANLPKETRKFLWYAVQALEKKTSYNGVEVNVATLQGRLELSSEQFFTEISRLEHADLIDTDARESENRFILQFYVNGDETIKDLHKFCIAKNIPFEDLIGEIGFNLLD